MELKRTEVRGLDLDWYYYILSCVYTSTASNCFSLRSYNVHNVDLHFDLFVCFLL